MRSIRAPDLRVVVGMEWLHIWNEKKRFEIGDFEILSLAHSRRSRNDLTLARSSKLFSLAEAQYHRRQKGFFSRVKNTET